jgi:uncharacterized membrane protein YuzA (DUF378 family)
MSSVVLLIMVAIISLLITRVATIALTVTGMSRQSARFQARSALTGVGFTTSESEAVVNHPVRRRIVMTLRMVGSLGLATAVAGLLGSFAGADNAGQTASRVAFLVVGLAGVYVLSHNRWVDQRLSLIGERLLRRHTDLDVQDYVRLLHLSGDYSVKEMATEEGDWIVGRPLGELRLRDEGMLVLGVVRRDGSYVGVPDKDTVIEPGDTAILYGRDDVFADLAERHSGAEGDRAHEQVSARFRRALRTPARDVARARSGVGGRAGARAGTGGAGAAPAAGPTDGAGAAAPPSGTGDSLIAGDGAARLEPDDE